MNYHNHTEKTRKSRGFFGENAVREYLAKHDCEIVTSNYRRKNGEIDIVATDGREIIFVEVKTRRFGSATDALSALTIDKRRRIVSTARIFLSENGQFGGMNARFDAAQVVITTEEFPRVIEIDYYKDVFNPALL